MVSKDEIIILLSFYQRQIPWPGILSPRGPQLGEACRPDEEAHAGDHVQGDKQLAQAFFPSFLLGMWNRINLLPYRHGNCRKGQ
jgi:hypothetical protein